MKEINISEVQKYLDNGWIIKCRYMFPQEHEKDKIWDMNPQTVEELKRANDLDYGWTTWLEKDGERVDWGYLGERKEYKVFSTELIDAWEEYKDSCIRGGRTPPTLTEYALSELSRKPRQADLARYLGVNRATVSGYPKEKKELMILGLWLKNAIQNG